MQGKIRKVVFAALIGAIMCIGAIASADYDCQMEYIGGEAVIQASEPMKDVSVIAADYDESGVLQGVELVKTELEAGQNNVTISAKGGDKLMLWSADMKPLCEAFVYTIQDANYSVELNTNLFSGKIVSDTRQFLEFYNSDSAISTTKYELSTANDESGTWRLLVNGVEVSATDENVNFYLNQAGDNPDAAVVLTDNLVEGKFSVDGKYDIVSVTYSVTAVVDVVAENTSRISIFLKDQTAASNAPYGKVGVRMDILKDDASKSYKFVKNGNEINVLDVKEWDVLTIEFSPDSFSDSPFYDVTVSDSRTEGKCTEMGRTDKYERPYCVIGGDRLVTAANMDIDPIAGEYYTAYLTAKGEIAYLEVIAVSHTYGVIDGVYTSVSYEEMVGVICKDGVRREYEIDSSSNMAVIDKVKAAMSGTIEERYASVTVDERIVDYVITSRNTIRVSQESRTHIGSFLSEPTRYNADTSRLGSYLIGEDTTILDMSDVITGDSVSAKPVFKSDFFDGLEYTGAAATSAYSSFDKVCPFVIITGGLRGGTADTPAEYGVVDGAYTRVSGEEVARIICKDGIRREYEIDSSSDRAVIDKVKAATVGTAEERYASVNASDRIVKYIITPNNTIRVTPEETIRVDSFMSEPIEYNSSASKLGQHLISEDTVILDMSDLISGYSGMATAITASSLVNSVEYTGAAARAAEAADDEVCPFVLITGGLNDIKTYTQMSVISAVHQTIEDDVERVLLTFWTDGGLKQMMCADNNPEYLNFNEGDVIIYTTDFNGYIDKIIPIFADGFDPSDISNKYSYLKQIAQDGLINDIGAGIAAQSDRIVSSNSDIRPGTDGAKVEYVFGPVLGKSTSSITIGAVGYGQLGDKTNTQGLNAYYANIAGKTYPYEADVKVYRYEGEERVGYKIWGDIAGGVAKSYIARPNQTTTSYIDTDGTMINLGMEGEGTEQTSMNTIAFALLRVYDNRVQEVYSITMPDDDYMSEFVAK